MEGHINKQLQFWKTEYAQEYMRTNDQFDLEKGIKAWARMLRKTDKIAHILECGSNIGRNIAFLNHLLPSASKSIVEISPDAFSLARSRYDLKDAFNTSIVDADLPEMAYDLVFTMGVLIMIHPDDLMDNMQKIYQSSARYILMGEYFNRMPVSIDYHGRQDLLFKQDFGKMFIQNFDVNLLDYGFLWGYQYDEAGFDDITYWLFEKKDRQV